MENEKKKELFIQKLQQVYPHVYPEIIENSHQTKPVTFRINLLKASEKEVLANLSEDDYIIEKGPLDNSFILVSSQDGKRLSESESFKAGKIYIQSLSSMLPAIVLDPKPNEKILDLCAAPGSKTSQMAGLTNNQANIVAVDNNRNRFFALKNNLETQGVKNVDLVLTNASLLLNSHPQYYEYFDKVLADVPCSNEALLNINDERSFKYWKSSTPSRLSKLQKGIAAAGINSLKKGGILVYSTCTYSIEENEMVADWLLKKFKVQVIPIDLPGANTITGIVYYKNKELNSQVKNCVRVLPSNLFTGFFLAKMIKV